ncbi:MAG: ornithine carbamoyltransferase [Acidobacteriota bacterium]
MRATDLISLGDLSPRDITEVLDLAAAMKRQPGRYRRVLEGRTLALLFEKPSLRTRATFQVAMIQLGGQAIYFGPGDISLGVRESVPDVARNLERWVDFVAARVFEHQKVVDLAEHARVPVLNALSDQFHPCQALADYLTLRERLGRLAGRQLVYVGDGNNVAHSLLLGGAHLGMHVRVITPPGYEPAPGVLEQARSLARSTGARMELGRNVLEGVCGADAVYTDVWASMGQEEETQTRRERFGAYQINSRVMEVAGPRALFMHCLPAHRGEEVTDEVADSPRSVIFEQAENRLHTQKALLVLLGRAARRAARSKSRRSRH